MAKAKKAATPKVAKNTAALNVYQNSAGKWVYPTGNMPVTLVPAPKGLGSKQLTYYNNLVAAFGGSKKLTATQLATILAKLKTGTAARRIIRRAGRAGCYTFTV